MSCELPDTSIVYEDKLVVFCNLNMIELNEKWAYNIIKLVGNYKEVFDRNLGQNTLLNLDRGLNNLYLNGGLLYSPPFK